MRFFNKITQQTGTAIFMALLVVTIVTAWSIVWFREANLNMRRTQQMLTTQQIYLSAEGVLDWGMVALQKDANMPKILSQTPILSNQGMISGKLDQFVPFKDKGHAPKTALPNREYFILRTEVRLFKQRLILYSLLHRELIDGNIRVSIIGQSRGIV